MLNGERRAAAFAVLALLFPSMASAGRMQGTGSGSIVLEAKNPGEAYKVVLEAAGRHGAVTSSYNAQVNPQTGKMQVSAQFFLEKEKAGVFMSEVAALGEVKSQNYYERGLNTSVPAIPYEEQIAVLDREFAVLGPLIAKVPTIMGYAAQQRQTLANQIRYVNSTDDEKATLSLTIMEAEGSAGPVGGAKKGGVPLPWALCIGVLVALVFSWMGFFFGRLRPVEVRQSS